MRIVASTRESTRLPTSIGLAPNKFLAKVGSDLGKPDGFVTVAPGQERAVLDPLPISRLWGVGPKTEARLHQMGFQTIGQILSILVPCLLGLPLWAPLAAMLGYGFLHLLGLEHGKGQEAEEEKIRRELLL
jgi:hypothetical protein